MDKKNKSIDYNTKISQKEFDSLESQRSEGQKKKRQMIESRFNGGTLGGLQERLRLSKTPSESRVLKAQYKDIDAKNNASGIDEDFQLKGIDRSERIGYANYMFYDPGENKREFE